MGLQSLLRAFGAIAYESIRYPTRTSIISREDGRVVARYRNWNDYLKEENKYPYSRYIVV
jgi:hypothetical protein